MIYYPILYAFQGRPLSDADRVTDVRVRRLRRGRVRTQVMPSYRSVVSVLCCTLFFLFLPSHHSISSFLLPSLLASVFLMPSPRDFNDVSVLDLETWEWRPVECSGEVPEPRSGHQVNPLISAIFVAFMKSFFCFLAVSGIYVLCANCTFKYIEFLRVMRF